MGSRCAGCERRHRAKYGPVHQAARLAWAPRVEAGTVACWRCGELIVPGTPWDLGHVDDVVLASRLGLELGERRPEHQDHNRSAAASKVVVIRQSWPPVGGGPSPQGRIGGPRQVRRWSVRFRGSEVLNLTSCLVRGGA